MPSITNYDSRVAVTRKLPLLRLKCHYFYYKTNFTSNMLTEWARSGPYGYLALIFGR